MKKLSVKKSTQSTSNTSTDALVLDDFANVGDVTEGKTDAEDGRKSNLESKVKGLHFDRLP